ncbi:MAG: response regulator [Piscinibacter sp.]|uniref:response regulator n=1 Tax=Piscinibacter sp. TaxID=1903157 RepID=UPI002586687B|nr:response regulator [Piscinibacter sp.]MCW5664512.1 response regulator [Piscinibacter sp.]
MRRLDADIDRAVALVADGNPASRSVLVNMLRDAGVGRIVQATRAQDARRLLEQGRFDTVVCEFHFDHGAMNGQELMDDLRQAGLLPLATVVVMISGEADYGHVAEAAEAALDAYLIKPHTEAALRERLAQARQRKRALAEVIAQVEAGSFEAAADRALQLAEARGVAWLQAARVAAELHLRLGRAADAARLLETILRTGALPWARLGVARAQVEAGAVFQARRTLESLLGEHPGYADAYDVMGRVLLDQGEPVQAIEALRRAVRLTPNCVSRQAKLGLLVFYYGDPREALVHLDAAVRLGLNSRVFDLQALVLQAALQFDRRDRRALALTAHAMARLRADAPHSPRLRRFESSIAILVALLERRVPEAIELLQALMTECEAPDFEFEAACNLLMVLSRVDRAELHLVDFGDRVGRLAERFAVSRTTCELMCGALRGDLGSVERIRAAYAGIGAAAEQAVSLALEGRPRDAALALLERARRTLNAKLMDLALHTLERHRAAIADAPALLAQVHALQRQHASYGTQPRMARVDDARSLVAVARPATMPR